MTTVPGRASLAQATQEALWSVDPEMPVQTDPNVPFSPPQNRPWARLTFRDGDQRLAAVGQPLRLWRGAALMFVDVFVPAGAGDADAVSACAAVREGLRSFDSDGLRFERFEAGAEGPAEGWYRKQLIVVLRHSERG